MAADARLVRDQVGVPTNGLLGRGVHHLQADRAKTPGEEDDVLVAPRGRDRVRRVASVPLLQTDLDARGGDRARPQIQSKATQRVRRAVAAQDIPRRRVAGDHPRRRGRLTGREDGPAADGLDQTHRVVSLEMNAGWELELVRDRSGHPHTGQRDAPATRREGVHGVAALLPGSSADRDRLRVARVGGVGVLQLGTDPNAVDGEAALRSHPALDRPASSKEQITKIHVVPGSGRPKAERTRSVPLGSGLQRDQVAPEQRKLRPETPVRPGAGFDRAVRARGQLAEGPQRPSNVGQADPLEQATPFDRQDPGCRRARVGPGGRDARGGQPRSCLFPARRGNGGDGMRRPGILPTAHRPSPIALGHGPGLPRWTHDPRPEQTEGDDEEAHQGDDENSRRRRPHPPESASTKVRGVGFSRNPEDELDAATLDGGEEPRVPGAGQGLHSNRTGSASGWQIDRPRRG